MKRLSLVFAGLAVLLSAYSIYRTFISSQKIGYVYNSRILSEYKGVIEARKMYEGQVEQWQSNLDTLSRQVQSDIEVYNAEKSGLSETEQKLREELIQRKQNELFTYKQALEQKATENDQKMTSEVLLQIDSYIQEYGKKHGYDFVLGVADNGNMLYAKDAYDLTDEILDKLNQRYEGE